MSEEAYEEVDFDGSVDPELEALEEEELDLEDLDDDGFPDEDEEDGY
jgi:hypothetical protein